jgi:cation transport ATPase
MRFLGEKIELSAPDLLRVPLLLAPLLALALTGTWWGASPLGPLLSDLWIPVTLGVVVQLGVCLPIYVRTACKLSRLQVDGDVLLATGASASLVLGLWRFTDLAADAEPDQWLTIWRDMAFGAGLLSVAMLGDILMRSAARTALLPLRPAPAGRVVVAPGDLVPGDGRVIDGAGEIQDPVGADDVFPVVVNPGSRVHLGARNGDAALTIELEMRAGGSRLEQKGPEQKGPASVDRLQLFLDRLARLALTIALAAIVWRLWQPGSDVHPLAAALQMLALAAPLALGLVLAAPSSEVLRAARAMGVEVKSLAALDRLRHVRAVVFGHRGVLVPDRLRMISAHPVEGVAPTDLIRRAAAIAQLGHDPWGKAILDFAVNYRMRLKPATDYTSRIGEGIAGRTENADMIVGSRDFLEKHGIDCSALEEAASAVLRQGRRLRWVAQSAPTAQLLGFLVFGAPSVRGAVETVKNLGRLGLTTAWLADQDDAAHQALAKQLKVDCLLPERAEATAAALRRLREETGPLLIVAADAKPDGESDDDTVLPFGRRLMEQAPGWMLGTTRHDPRVIVDLLRLAARHRQMVRINAAIAYVSAMAFAFAPLWLGARDDLGSYEVGVVLLLALSALSLRAMPTTANEVDEE